MNKYDIKLDGNLTSHTPYTIIFDGGDNDIHIYLSYGKYISLNMKKWINRFNLNQRTLGFTKRTQDVSILRQKRLGR